MPKAGMCLVSLIPSLDKIASVGFVGVSGGKQSGITVGQVLSKRKETLPMNLQIRRH
jgi:hypothetical protein